MSHNIHDNEGYAKSDVKKKVKKKEMYIQNCEVLTHNC